MFFLEIIQQFILPSTFIPLIIALGVFLLFCQRYFKIGRIVVLSGLIFYYFFSITPVADLLLAPLEERYQRLLPAEMTKADQIVLLLGGRESDVLRASEVLRIAHLTNQRTRIIISGTDPINPKSGEAPAVRKFFIARGVPAENITIEGASRNTWENVRNTAKIVENQPFFLVTSASHLTRAMREFERVDTNPIPAPTDFRRKGEYTIFDFFPSAQDLRNSDLALHEYFGILFYNFLQLK